jgi:hypothetical protein
MMTLEERHELHALEQRIRTILPKEYQDSYPDVEPVSMGSAGLKFGSDGRVAWDDIWGSFCDLAMAGGPPHKGELLLPASQEEIDADPKRYGEVVDEICRGIKMAAGLTVRPSPVPGWVRVNCDSAVTAGWLARAIVMENVSARCEGTVLELPAGPGFRVEKEIKNVITSIAKTSHYWQDHVWTSQQKVIEALFATIASESPLIQPALASHAAAADLHHSLSGKISEKILEATGLMPWQVPRDGWVGTVCPSVKAAIWMMRALVVKNVFARREGTVVFVPVNPTTDPSGDLVPRVFSTVHRLARVAGVL